MHRWLLALAFLFVLPVAPACGGSGPQYRDGTAYRTGYYGTRYERERQRRYRNVDYRQRRAVCRDGYRWDGRVCRHPGQGRGARKHDYSPRRYNVH